MVTRRKKEMKPITSKLQAANLFYKWITPGKIQILYLGMLYYSMDEEMGYALLQSLNLEST